MSSSGLLHVVSQVLLEWFLGSTGLVGIGPGCSWSDWTQFCITVHDLTEEFLLHVGWFGEHVVH